MDSQAEIWTDEEVRHLAIDLMTEATERDAQTRIGASNLSNGCDFCLASNFLGNDRSTPITDRAWLGRVLGTAIHFVLEWRVNRRIRQMRDRLQGAKAEHHVWFADIEGYGQVGGTIDLLLTARHLLDWKGSTRKKIALLHDYLLSQGVYPEGTVPKWVLQKRGNYKFGNDSLSASEYAAEMASMAHKVTGYYGQATLYMHGSGAHRASLVFVARDGTGYFDNPAGDRYADPKATHDIFVLSFDYAEEYALALIRRGQDIWNHLQAGGTPDDFERHAHCFACSIDQREAAKVVKLEAAAGDVTEVTFGASAAA